MKYSLLQEPYLYIFEAFKIQLKLQYFSHYIKFNVMESEKKQQLLHMGSKGVLILDLRRC
jgi:hypothetical protein